jgi:hypothetical protein
VQGDVRSVHAFLFCVQVVGVLTESRIVDKVTGCLASPSRRNKPRSPGAHVNEQKYYIPG